MKRSVSLDNTNMDTLIDMMWETECKCYERLFLVTSLLDTPHLNPSGHLWDTSLCGDCGHRINTMCSLDKITTGTSFGQGSSKSTQMRSLLCT
uniref:Ovule protein n=1 Tax=Heterorhabditis bacteriophora TaxID=37862 RepID=A0A1I7X421_HETBA